MLDQLQHETEQALWGDQPVQGSVIASDFYNASAIAELSDQEVVDCLMQDLLPMAQPAFHELWLWTTRCGVTPDRCLSFRQEALVSGLHWKPLWRPWSALEIGYGWARESTELRAFAKSVPTCAGWKQVTHCFAAGS
jgi:hypothetical protein